MKSCILPGLLYRELNLLPICSEGPWRPGFFPECSCRPALPFLPGILRVYRTVLSRKLLLITPGLACTGVHALLQHRGGKVRPLCLDPGPCTLPPSHTQFPTPATVCCRSNPLELSGEGGWASSLQNSQNVPATKYRGVFLFNLYNNSMRKPFYHH